MINFLRKYKERDVLAMYFNILVILFELFGFIPTIMANAMDYTFYTLDSNLLALFAAIIYLLYLIRNKKIPKWVSILKYTSVLSLMVTFLVVLFILCPMFNFAYLALLFNSTNMYFHTLCPILAFISFVTVEKHEINGFKDNFRAIYFTIIYAIILVALNTLNIVDGPYPFLKVYDQSIFMSILWTIIIVGGAFGIGKLIQIIKNNIEKKKYSKLEQK